MFTLYIRAKNWGLDLLHCACIYEIMKTPHEIVAALGRADLQETLGVPTSAVTNALARGDFPTSWYLPMKKLAKKKRVALPDELFKWREVSA